MVGHGSILAFDERTNMRELARHLLEFGADESCGKCFPCRIGLRRGLEMVERPGPVDRERLEALLETLELASLCAHGGGMPAPIRSLIAHFPEELGVSGGDAGDQEPKGDDDPFMRRPAEPAEKGEETDW
jgi:NADH:ubiquinone oxidoreductase subunit F (NADH-binding)